MVFSLMLSTFPNALRLCSCQSFCKKGPATGKLNVFPGVNVPIEFPQTTMQIFWPEIYISSKLRGLSYIRPL